LRLQLLGGFEIRGGDGRDLAPSSRKACGLLACLATPPGTAWPRDRLAAVFWSDREEAQARGSVRQALTDLRHCLGAGAPLQIGRDSVMLDPAAAAVDAMDFELAVKAGDLERAETLYRGDLLDGFTVHSSGFHDWLLVERTRLRDLAVDALTRLAASQTGNASIQTCQRLLQIDPTREEAHRLLMSLYAGQDQRALALRQFQICRDTLKRELGTGPDPETEALFRQLQKPKGYSAPAPPAGQEIAASLSGKPSLAILPFTNMSDDPQQQYFSDGITEDIITELSRFRSLFLISRNSSFRYRGTVDVQRVGQELGVQFVVQGSVRRLDRRLRIAVQLVDATTGGHLWAENYDRDMMDLFVLQDDVARSVAATIGFWVDAAGRERAMHLQPAGFSAYEYVLRSRALVLRLTKADNRHARLLAEKAIKIDPVNCPAHAQLALIHWIDYMAFWAKQRGASLRKAYEFAEQAVMLDEADSRARWLLGQMHLYRREYDEARTHVEKALELNPNDTEARAVYGIFLTSIGEPLEAIAQFEIARRHNPFDFNWVPWVKGIAYFTAHRYDDAIATLRQVHNPINEVRGWLAASYASVGRRDEARTAIEEFLAVAKRDMTAFPGRKLRNWESYWHGAIEYRNQSDFDHLFAALRAAGMR